MRIAELDGLRGIGILAVLEVHAYGRLPGSWLAIDVFFVLSGYLITSALQRDGSLPRFFGRRIARIWPPVAGTVALAYAIAPGFQLDPFTYLFANFVDPSALGSLAHFWYLAIEEQFYLLWPFAFLFFRRGLTLGIVIAAAWVFHVWTVANGADSWTIYGSTFSRMDALAIGCGLALVRPRIGKRVGEVSLAALLLALLVAEPEPLTLVVGLALYPLICAGVIRASRQVAVLRFPPLVYLGERSWGIYMYHWPIFCALSELHQAHRPAEWIVFTILKVGLTLALAELSYRTIERWSQKIDLTRMIPATGSTAGNAGE